MDQKPDAQKSKLVEKFGNVNFTAVTTEQNVTTFKKAATDLDLRIPTMTDDGVIGVVVGVDLKKNTSSYCYAFRVLKHH